jgi:hypothetical protein
MDVESDSGASRETTASLVFVRRVRRFIALIAFTAILVLQVVNVYYTTHKIRGGGATLHVNFNSTDNSTDWTAFEELLDTALE